jgi:hypothetical protein
MTKPKTERPPGYLRVPQPNSMVTQIAELEVGQSLARAGRIDGDQYKKATYDELLDSMRNTVNKAAQRAKARTGGEYVIEAGSYRTLSGDYIVTVAVTRMT